MDIFTGAVSGIDEGMCWGVKVQAGPVGTGLNFTVDDYVLRGGLAQTEYRKGWLLGGPHDEWVEAHVLLAGVGAYPGVRKKSRLANIFGLYIPASFIVPEKKVGLDDLYPLTQIEVMLGLYYGFRIGINPGELLDLILGFTTLDIYGDDVEGKKQPTQESIKE